MNSSEEAGISYIFNIFQEILSCKYNFSFKVSFLEWIFLLDYRKLLNTRETIILYYEGLPEKCFRFNSSILIELNNFHNFTANQICSSLYKNPLDRELFLYLSHILWASSGATIRHIKSIYFGWVYVVCRSTVLGV